MIVLGISPLDKDATVSLVINGKVVFAAGEERFTRVKLQDGFPEQALRAGVQYAGIRVQDIDIVAYPFFDSQRESQLFTKNICDEKVFLEETPLNGSRQKIESALAKVPTRNIVIPGLGHPNEKMVKPFVNKVFYRLAGGEPIIPQYRQTCLTFLG